MVAAASVVHVVLTGGGCAGKSSTTHAAADVLRTQGLRVLTVDETATQIINAGISDIGTLDPEVRRAMQYDMVRLMRANWLVFHNLACILAAAGDSPVVVLHDQGEMAGDAYLGADAFAELLTELGTDVNGILAAYDLAVICHSASRTGGYETDSNEARYEDVEFARMIDEAIERSWATHPNTVTIPWQDSHDAKVGIVVGAVNELLARPDAVAA